MRLGQTSIVHFVSRLLASSIGFVATIYFARRLGPSMLGTYFLVLSTVSWLGVIATFGIPGAIKKRVSEGSEDMAYLLAGVTLVGLLVCAVSLVVALLHTYVDAYIGYHAVGVIVLVLVVKSGWTVANSYLTGRRMVHFSGMLSPIRTGVRSIVQIGSVALGLGLTGLFAGYVSGYLFGLTVACVLIARWVQDVGRPSRQHYRQILSYARFAWIGTLRYQAFEWVDIAVLGLFVTSSVVGVYSVAWNIAVFLILFGGSLSQTVFPEISRHSADKNDGEVTSLFETSLMYAGLFLIPGLVGGTLLGTRLLRVYGSEFTNGTTILSLLIIVALVQGYQRQFVSTLNAIDRPSKAFRVNATFVAANVVFNFALIPLFGAPGAAIATALAVAVSLAVAYFVLSAWIEISIPIYEIAKQWVAAATMGVVVYAGLYVQNTYVHLSQNVVVVVALVITGAGVYFVSLLGLSPQFRTTVRNNLPFAV